MDLKITNIISKNLSLIDNHLLNSITFKVKSTSIYISINQNELYNVEVTDENYQLISFCDDINFDHLYKAILHLLD